MPDNDRMLLLNVVCLGPEQKMMHKHVVSARDSGRLADSGKFRLEWYDRPQPGILERLSLITYVPSHGGRSGNGAASGFTQWAARSRSSGP